MQWADSALAIDPTYQLGRSAAVILALEARDLGLAEQHLLALQRVVHAARERVATADPCCSTCGAQE